MASGKCRDDAKAKARPRMVALFPGEVQFSSYEAGMAAAVKLFLAAV
jgi:hypothetical protein